MDGLDMKTKAEALKLIGAFAIANIRHYQAVNTVANINPRVAAKNEYRAARQLIKALTGEPITEEEYLASF